MKWNELSRNQQRSVLGAVTVDGVLKAIAWHFLYHTPARKIRGPKWLWTVITGAVGTVGPLAFLIAGRKR